MRKGIWIFIIILIIVIGVICGIAFSQSEKTVPSAKLQNIEENVTTNNETNVTEIEQNIIEDNVEENTIVNNEQSDTTNTSTETTNEEPKTDAEKAIQIAKKDFGNTSEIQENIEYNVEGVDENGRYIVTVRKTTTTEALAFYFVNVSDSTFTKKEME